MKVLNDINIMKKTKIILNILIFLLTIVFIYNSYSTVNSLLHAQPFIYKKYFYSKKDSEILKLVNINDNSPITLHDDLDNYHSIYSIYQKDQLVFKSRYPSDDEQKVIDLILKAHDRRVSIFFSLFFTCIILRLVIRFRINILAKRSITNNCD